MISVTHGLVTAVGANNWLPGRVHSHVAPHNQWLQLLLLLGGSCLITFSFLEVVCLACRQCVDPKRFTVAPPAVLFLPIHFSWLVPELGCK